MKPTDKVNSFFAQALYVVIGMFCVLGPDAFAVESDASRPHGTVLSVYDQGFGLVNEVRRITTAPGRNRLRFTGVPAGIDPRTLSFIPLGTATDLDVVEQRFRHDTESAATMLRRYIGQSIEVRTQSGTERGVLLHASGWEPHADRQAAFLVLETASGLQLFLNAADIEHVALPEPAQYLALQPELIWTVESEREGPENIRMSYLIEGLEWLAQYDVIVQEDGRTAYFGGRISLKNESPGTFSNAQVRLITTESGLARDERQRTVASGARRQTQPSPPMRYAYGADAPTFEEAVSGPVPVDVYNLPETVTLAPDDHVFIRYVQADRLSVERFFVYDGVLFDRFQRFRRNDWNYGTESHSVVDAHLQFVNESAEGLGVPLPPGRFRLYQRKAEDIVDFIGEDQLLTTPVDGTGHVRLGAAPGLRGERERTGYVEVTPMRVYEESFRITLENNSEDTAEIRVVEHLYRWHDFEIVRADAEYELVGEQTIEFRPELRPGGRRTIHYTVRYSW